MWIHCETNETSISRPLTFTEPFNESLEEVLQLYIKLYSFWSPKAELCLCPVPKPVLLSLWLWLFKELYIFEMPIVPHLEESWLKFSLTPNLLSWEYIHSVLQRLLEMPSLRRSSIKYLIKCLRIYFYLVTFVHWCTDLNNIHLMTHHNSFCHKNIELSVY